MLGSSPAAAWQRSGTKWCAPIATRRNCRSSNPAGSRFTSLGWKASSPRPGKAGRLSFCPNPADAIAAGDAIFICVGTPPLPNGDADLSAIDHVARVVATEARSSKLVIEKSTVPARTGQELKRALSVYGRRPGVVFRVVSNPEFLREGTAVADFLHPDRIVVGVEDEIAEQQMKEIYRPVLERKFKCPVHSPACPDGRRAALARNHDQQRRTHQARLQFVPRAQNFLRQHGGGPGGEIGR